jgi:hypothetical protein
MRKLNCLLFYICYIFFYTSEINLQFRFKNVLEMAEDMAIDIPRIATYLSQIIGKTVYFYFAFPIRR